MQMKPGVGWSWGTDLRSRGLSHILKFFRFYAARRRALAPPNGFICSRSQTGESRLEIPVKREAVDGARTD